MLKTTQYKYYLNKEWNNTFEYEYRMKHNGIEYWRNLDIVLIKDRILL